MPVSLETSPHSKHCLPSHQQLWKLLLLRRIVFQRWSVHVHACRWSVEGKLLNSLKGKLTWLRSRVYPSTAGTSVQQRQNIWPAFLRCSIWAARCQRPATEPALATVAKHILGMGKYLLNGFHYSQPLFPGNVIYNHYLANGHIHSFSREWFACDALAILESWFREEQKHWSRWLKASEGLLRRSHVLSKKKQDHPFVVP